MTLTFENIEKGLETLKRCQLLAIEIGKLPKCKLRSSLLECVNSLMDTDMSHTSSPSRRSDSNLMSENMEGPHGTLNINNFVDRMGWLASNLDGFQHYVESESIFDDFPTKHVESIQESAIAIMQYFADFMETYEPESGNRG